jgi:hypothetical protein
LYNIALESGQYYRGYNPMFLYKNANSGSGGRSLMAILNFKCYVKISADDTIPYFIESFDSILLRWVMTVLR